MHCIEFLDRRRYTNAYYYYYYYYYYLHRNVYII